jgi:SAM-dependent methyltransferase
VTRDATKLLEKMIWHDNEHLQIGDTCFLLTVDAGIWDTTIESTPEQFLLLKNWWLVQNTLQFLPETVDNMIELGIFEGGSIAFYEELFLPARFVGVDIETDRVRVLDHYLERRLATERVRLYYGTDQQDRQALELIAHENFEDQPLDLVIDDASHFYEPAKTSLNVFLPLPRPGGVYLIEDWAWAHWQQGFEEFQAKGTTGYADQKSPLTKLIFEAVMLAASRPDIISNVYIDASRAFLTRGQGFITDEDFDISDAYLTSRWKMDFSAKTTPVDMLKRWVPLSIRKRVPPSIAAWAHEHIPH